MSTLNNVLCPSTSDVLRSESWGQIPGDNEHLSEQRLQVSSNIKSSILLMTLRG